MYASNRTESAIDKLMSACLSGLFYGCSIRRMNHSVFYLSDLNKLSYDTYTYLSYKYPFIFVTADIDQLKCQKMFRCVEFVIP
jgi:hypothetical protein